MHVRREQNTNKVEQKDETMHRNISKTTSEGKCDFSLKHRVRLGHLGQAGFDESSVILFSSKTDVPDVFCLISYPVKPHFAT